MATLGNKSYFQKLILPSGTLVNFPEGSQYPRTPSDKFTRGSITLSDVEPLKGHKETFLQNFRGTLNKNIYKNKKTVNVNNYQRFIS
jgi:hypothetical protein